MSMPVQVDDDGKWWVEKVHSISPLSFSRPHIPGMIAPVTEQFVLWLSANGREYRGPLPRGGMIIWKPEGRIWSW